jgi:methyl-accepting chemotaxis protein
MLRRGDFLFRVDDRHDKWVFLGTFFLGAVLIVVLRVVGVSLYVVVIPPIVLLIGYAVYVLGTQRMSVSLDRAGDNLYYLGLLFTLVSLSVSLVQVFSAGESVPKVFDLLSSFGIALASTILGMFLRILVQQFRNEPVDVERAVRFDLQDAARLLRDQLHATTVDFNTYRRTLYQSLEELQGELSGTIKRVTDSAADSLEKTSQGLSNTGGRLQEISHTQGNALESTVERFLGAMDALIAKIDGIEVDTGVVSSRFKKAAAALEKVGGQLVLRADAEEKAVLELTSLVSTISKLSASEFRSDLGQATAGISAIAGELSGTASTFRSVAQESDASIKRFQAALAAQVESLTQAAERMRIASDQAAASTSKVQEGLIEAVRDLRREIDR